MIEQLPTGSLLHFCWSLLISVSFQFIGFAVTYMLHTSHATKYGSRTGLGITLIQTGLYMKENEDEGGMSGNQLWGGNSSGGQNVTDTTPTGAISPNTSYLSTYFLHPFSSGLPPAVARGSDRASRWRTGFSRRDSFDNTHTESSFEGCPQTRLSFNILGGWWCGWRRGIAKGSLNTFDPGIT